MFLAVICRKELSEWKRSKNSQSKRSKNQRSKLQLSALDHKKTSGHGHSGILSLGKFGKYQRPLFG
jgi:hypothetical protein